MTDFTEFIAEVIANLVQHDTATPETITGCSQHEIEEFECATGKRIPRSYRAFLAAMGKGAGGLYRGTDAFYPRILHMNKGAKELLAEQETPLTLPHTSIVFAMHQGYIFWFLDDYNSDNPQVYSYYETGAKFDLITTTYTEYVLRDSLAKWC